MVPPRLSIWVVSPIETQSQLLYPSPRGGILMHDSTIMTGETAAAVDGCCDRACGTNGHAVRKGVALTSLKSGQVGVICETCTEPGDAMLLRAMGLRPNATIRICRLGEPCIVEVLPSRAGEGTQCSRADCRCRIGLAWLLAQRVMVAVAS